MNQMEIFKNPEFGSIRTFEQDGKVLFCGKDIAKALGYQRTADAITAHCKGVCVLPTPSNGGNGIRNRNRNCDFGRRHNNEGIGIFVETAVEDRDGSGDSGADPVRLDLCGDRLCLRSGAGAYQHGDRPAGCGGSADLFPAKRHYPAGDGIPY